MIPVRIVRASVVTSAQEVMFLPPFIYFVLVGLLLVGLFFSGITQKSYGGMLVKICG